MSETMNAALILATPVAQKPLGIGAGRLVDLAEIPASSGDQTRPPWLHSQAILSFPRCSSTIMMIARIALITMMNGHMNLHTLIQMYDLLDRAKIVITAADPIPIPMPPYICHSGKWKKKNCPIVKRKIPPPMLYAARMTAHAMAPPLSGKSKRQLSHHIYWIRNKTLWKNSNTRACVCK